MNPPSRSILLALLSGPLLACGTAAGPGPAPDDPAPSAAPAPTSVLDGVFTQDQAQRGRQVFRAVCAECHGTRDFRGETFFLSWEGTSVGRFLDRLVETMPDGDPGSLPIPQYVDVTAYILQLNGFPEGPAELSADAGRLERIRIERAGEPSDPGARP